MAKTEHADYLKAHPARRWSGGALPALWRVLNVELVEKARRAWRVLPGGAYVMLDRAADSNSQVLKIARSAKPKDDRGVEAFKREADTFARQFGITDWPMQLTNDPAVPGIAATFTQPAR